MSEETKAERQQDIQHYVTSELSDTNNDVLVSYYLTSIYDHSALEAFSKVITIYNFLNIFWRKYPFWSVFSVVLLFTCLRNCIWV